MLRDILLMSRPEPVRQFIHTFSRRGLVSIDRLPTRGVRPAGRHRNDFSSTHNNRSALNDGAISANDTGIVDSEVLRTERRKRPERQAGKYCQGVSFHANFFLPGAPE